MSMATAHGFSLPSLRSLTYSSESSMQWLVPSSEHVQLHSARSRPPTSVLYSGLSGHGTAGSHAATPLEPHDLIA